MNAAHALIRLDGYPADMKPETARNRSFRLVYDCHRQPFDRLCQCPGAPGFCNPLSAKVILKCPGLQAFRPAIFPLAHPTLMKCPQMLFPECSWLYTAHMRPLRFDRVDTSIISGVAGAVKVCIKRRLRKGKSCICYVRKCDLNHLTIRNIYTTLEPSSYSMGIIYKSESSYM